MDIIELKRQLAEKKVEARGLIETDLEKAETTAKEVRELQKKIDLLEEMEVQEKRDLEKQQENKKEKRKEEMAVNEVRSFTKAVLGHELNAEERATIKTTDNATVIPPQFINDLQEIKKGYGSLKSYVDIISVNKNAGTIPVIDLDQNALLEVKEGATITDGTLATTELSFECKKYGLITTLSSELIDDAEVEIEGLVRKNFAEIVTVKENVEILAVLEAGKADVVTTDYTVIETEIDSALPSVKAGLVLFVNVGMYAYLKNEKDKQGRNLNLITNVNGAEYFHGIQLIVYDGALGALTDATNKVAYLANAKEAVKFMDRKQVTVAKSTEAGFNDDTVKIRILERFDVMAGSKRSIKKFSIATE